MQRRLLALALALALAGSVTVGCTGGAADDEVPTGSVEASSAVDTGVEGVSSDSGETDAPSDDEPYAAPETEDAIDAELKAIEEELQNLQLPDDSDFSGAEGSLF